MSADRNQSLRNAKRKAQELLASGQTAEARSLLTSLCDPQCADPDIWLLLGFSHSALQFWQEAVACFHTVLKLRPKDANARFHLGNAFVGLRKYPEAVTYYEQALSLIPRWPEALNNMGKALHLAGRPEQAIPCFEQALKLQPDLTTAMANLARVYLDAGKHLQAIDYLQRALRRQPVWPEIELILGRAYMDVGWLSKAVRCFLDMLQRGEGPDSEKVYMCLGAVYSLQGRLEAAVDMFRQASRLRPDSVDAAVGEAIAYQYAGDHEHAAQAVRQLLDRGVRTPDLLVAFANMCKRLNACDEALDLVNEALHSTQLVRPARTTLLFSLARLYDNRRDYERAFEVLTEANRSVNVQFDPEEYRTYVDRIVGTFSKSAMRRLPRSGLSTEKPVFIVGMPRSGTTLIEQIISGHPDVYGAGELPNITNLACSLSQRLSTSEPFPQCMWRVQQPHIEAMAEDYLAALQAFTPTARLVTDKMPENFLYLGLINLLFPRAKIIHCMRDPRDTCLSIYFQDFGPQIPYASDLGDIAAVYGDYRKIMRHWEETLDLDMTTMVYHDLVNEPESSVQRLLSFLGLSWATECLDFHTRRRTGMATASYEQVGRPLYKTSLDRWTHYEPYIGALCDALAPWLV